MLLQDFLVAAVGGVQMLGDGPDFSRSTMGFKEQMLERHRFSAEMTRKRLQPRLHNSSTPA